MGECNRQISAAFFFLKEESVKQEQTALEEELLKEKPIIVVGSGPAGVHFVRKLHERQPERPILLFGAEPWRPYDRVRLSSFLSGDVTLEALANDHDLDSEQLICHYNEPVKKIFPESRQIEDKWGRRYDYDKLVLAVGSDAHVPNIPGVTLPGVFTFRDLSDVSHLMARRVRSRRTVVLGGGLLGLEAALAMKKMNTEVVVVEHGPKLLGNQLDETASLLVQQHLANKGIEFVLDRFVQEIIGELEVKGIRLSDGRLLRCDTIVLATGIRPRVELARSAGIRVGKGIIVDDTLRTSDDHVYAVGECSEHRGRVYGLVAPGIEQASVCAATLAGEEVSYTGSVSATRLKISGIKVFSCGVAPDQADWAQHKILRYRKNDTYRCLVFKHRRLVGAAAIGDWSASNLVQESITSERSFFLWHKRRFLGRGSLWPEGDGDPSNWPGSAVVCNCTSATVAHVRECVAEGCVAVEEISHACRAGSVCGSCRPLLAKFLGVEEKVEAPKDASLLFKAAVAGLLLWLAFVLFPPLPYVDSVQTLDYTKLWTNSLWKQVSGYTLAGLVLLFTLVLSLRKRWRKFQFRSLPLWRGAHAIFALLALGLLGLHTGLQAGEGVSFMLLLSFLFTALAGAGAALAVARESKMSPLKAKRIRRMANDLHLILAWPLPLLLGVHIAMVYYF